MRRFGIGILVVAIAALGLGACGGDDDDSSSDTTQATDTSDTASGDSDSDSTGSSDIDSLLAKQKEASIKITYEKNDGDTVTIANDGSSDPVKTSITEGDSMTISGDGDNMISCSGIDGDSPSCTEVPVGGNFLLTAGAALFGGFGLFLFAAEGAENVPFLDVEKSSDEVAGRSATCITWDLSKLGSFVGQVDSGDAVSFSGCFDDDTGWPLQYATKDSDGNALDGLEATEVGEPSDSDFEPPVTPETIPDIGDITIPSIPS